MLGEISCKAFAYEAGINNNLRAPAYPLITIDPYTSGWSFTDHLYDSSVRHWTGKERQLTGAVLVDGKNYRFMGLENVPMSMIVSTSEGENWKGTYTTVKPEGDWSKLQYNDSKWLQGKGAFGSVGRLKATTSWRTSDIWVRRIVNISKADLSRELYLEYSHDDGVEIFINGQEVINTGNSCKANEMLKLSEGIKKLLVPGKNIISAHCHDGGGESFLDFGIWMRKDNVQQFNHTAQQTHVNVMPTQTYYTFKCGGIQLDLIFTAPLLMNNLDLLSRPVNYLTYQVKSIDGKLHDVVVYVDATPQWAQDKINQPIQSGIVNNDKLNLLKTGTKSQSILEKEGDDVRIDWGYFYLSTPKEKNISYAIGNARKVRNAFLSGKALNNTCAENLFGDLTSNMEVLAIVHKMGKVGASMKSGYIMLGYDDIYPIQYFGQNLRPYWNRNGDKTIIDELHAAASDYSSVMQECAEFDKSMMKDAIAASGDKYADLCALAYRQAVSAHKLVQDNQGNLLFFSKENFSNGSIGTVDISYPSSPLFLIYNTKLVKALMNHIYAYSESGKWTKPFAAHDVGTYPLANGQTYGGDMPVEESGNMLIMSAAVCKLDNDASYAVQHWEVMSTWANYLLEHGMDPDNQLCTDDFAGHFAHNTNLSIKAIMGIASYGIMAQMLGKDEVAHKYLEAAKKMAVMWEKMANDGDHYRLTFDKSGTWSQKYNMVWDKLFETHLFDQAIYDKELAYYLRKQNKYGLPLDNRAEYTKSDWIMWTAALADNKSITNKIVVPVWLYANYTPSRVPLSDWHMTDSGSQRGFQARSVVGGYFILMLKDKMLKK